MPAVRFAIVVLAALALAAPVDAAVRAPEGVKGFLLRVDEPETRTFPRTPSFAWKPVAGAKRYEVELSTRQNFADSGLVWKSTGVTIPATSVPIALPWMTGAPYALYARVRAFTRRGTSSWSKPFGFNTRWSAVPQKQADQPGLVRWSTVEGATGYNVWFLEPNKVIATKTNVADEREYYSFHREPSWTTAVHWRVRAVRSKFGSSGNGIPAVSYGPWSPVYTSINPPVAAASIAASGAVADVQATTQPAPFKLMPGLTFSGDTALHGAAYELFRTYVSTDSDCVNVVYRGAVTGSPAYAPRVTGPLALPSDLQQLAKARAGYLADGGEGNTFTVDTAKSVTNEVLTPGGNAKSPTAAPPESRTEPFESAALAPPHVDLWDNGWPDSRYYWTVVAVAIVVKEGGQIEYHETELPQDACAAGRGGSFGKVTEAALAGAGAPFVSGLSPNGRLLSAARPRPAFYGTPLVAWKPALAADSYQVEWSRTQYPWRKIGSLETPSTATVLPLTPGAWYYRVRGVSLALPEGGRQMTWSDPVRLTVARPRFRVVP